MKRYNLLIFSFYSGLVVEPSKLYSQQVPATFKVTMASLGSNMELEATASVKSYRTSLIFNLDSKEDFTLCSLTTDKIEQQVLDLVLSEGETIAFRVEGPHAIHLSGYYINEEEDEDDGFIDDDGEQVYSDEAEEDSQIEYDSEEDSEDYDSEEESEEEMTKNPRIRVLESDEEDSEMDSEEEIDSEEEMDSEDEEMDSEEESDEEEEIEQVKASKKVKFDLTEAKKAKETPKEQVKAASPAKVTAPSAKVTPPPAKVIPAAAASPVSAAAKPASPQNIKEQVPTPIKKTLPSGLQIEDLKLGNGPKASNGKKVLIHYKGTLTNGQTFDSSFGGKPLKFAVGKGDVIKGMDMGIVGMAVGGSRKLVIPGPLAYGNQALPKIPRNSTLVFEIRLEKIL